MPVELLIVVRVPVRSSERGKQSSGSRTRTQQAAEHRHGEGPVGRRGEDWPPGVLVPNKSAWRLERVGPTGRPLPPVARDTSKWRSDVFDRWLLPYCHYMFSGDVAPHWSIEHILLELLSPTPETSHTI
jgi:hypothetical protein